MKPVLLASKLKIVPCSSAQFEFSVLASKSVPMSKAPVSIAVVACMAAASNTRCKSSEVAMVEEINAKKQAVDQYWVDFQELD